VKRLHLRGLVAKIPRSRGRDVLVTGAVRDALDPRVRQRAMPAVEVKGIPAPLVTYAVDAWAG
jgi:class 3 adenylate cyclase